MSDVTGENGKKSNRLISFGFLLLIIVGFGLIIHGNRDKLTEYKAVLINVNYWNLIISFVIAGVAIFFRSWRWYYLVRPIKETMSFLNVYGVSINALAANFTMPGKLGVPVKALLLKKSENVDMSKSLPSIFGEIIVEHSSEFIIALFCVFIGGHLSKLFYTVDRLVESNLVINIGFILAIVVIFVGIGILFRKKIKSVNLIHQFVESIQLTRKRLDYLGYSYLITTINLLFAYYGFYLVVAALGHPEIDLTFVIFAGTITNFVGLISPFPGGVGAREITIYGLYDFYFGLGGIALLAIILMRLITYLALFLSFLIERTISGWSHSRRRKELSVSS